MTATSRYGRPLKFGLSVVPASADLELAPSLARRASELGFDTFVFWPDDEPLDQVQRFAEEVVPALRR